MYHQQPPPPPTWQPPPPPPLTVSNPMELQTEWYIDVPTGSLEPVLAQINSIGNKFNTHISLVAGGDQVSRWGRLCLVGKPLGIHYSIADIMQLTKCSEVGQRIDAPFPVGIEPQPDEDAELIPVFHGAWTEFNIRNQQR